jgi:16S rRNA processing protein RimM
MLMSTLLMTDSSSHSSDERLLEVGRIGKPHGIKGDVFVMFVSDREERRVPGARFVANVDVQRTNTSQKSSAQKRIESREIEIESLRSQKDRYVVHFVGVDSREHAEELTNATLFAAPIEDDDALWVHEVIGSRVQGVDGVVYGVCTGVIDNPAHAILELDSGGLVPTPFIVSYEDGVTTIDPPLGLFEDIEPTAPNA